MGSVQVWKNSGFDRGIKSAPWQRTQIYMQTKYKLIDGNNNNNNKTSYHNPITVSKMADDGAKASNLESTDKNKMADFITVLIRVPKFFIQGGVANKMADS